MSLGKRRPARRRGHRHRLEFDCLEARNLLSAVRIANWNVNNGPNLGNGDNFSLVVDAIGQETVLGNTRAIDVLVLAETDSDSALQLDNVFDSLYNTSAYEFITSTADGGSDRTGFIYNTDTVSLLETFELPDMTLTHRALRARFRPVGASPFEDFFVYAVHLKSGDGSPDIVKRAEEAAVIRSDADVLGQGANVIFAGDFNLNSSAEGAWSTFYAAGNGAATDVANTPGAWSHDPSFKTLHSHAVTQLDGRFDFQFISDELTDGVGLDYIESSFHVFGNNGTHDFDGLITSGTGASPEVLDALFAASDHLPVVADYEIISTIPGVVVVESGGSTDVSEGGSPDSYEIFLRTSPTADVTITATPDSQLDIGAGPGVATDLIFTTKNGLVRQTIFVSAFDDSFLEGPHFSSIDFAVTSIDFDYENFVVEPVSVFIADNDATPLQPLLNEVYVNPPGADDNREYIEIVAQPFEQLSNIWLLEIEGDSSGNPGFVEKAQNLSSLQTGSNGLLLLGDDYLTSGHPWADEVDSTTTLAHLSNGAIENGTITFLLVESFTGSTGIDIDSNNDGIFDFVPWDFIWDSVSWTDGGQNDRTYSQSTLAQDGTPDAATRIPGDFDPNSSASWYNGDISGTGTTTIYGNNRSPNSPVDAVVTPGSSNFGHISGELAPYSSTLIRGILGEGDANDLQFSDNLYFSAFPDATTSTAEPPVWIELEGISPDLNPSSLSFQLEAHTNTVNLTQTIEVFNFDTKQFVSLDIQDATLIDSVVALQLPGDPSDFVEDVSGQIKSKVSWIANGPVFQYPWSISIDQAIWSVNTVEAENSNASTNQNLVDRDCISCQSSFFQGRDYRVLAEIQNRIPRFENPGLQDTLPFNKLVPTETLILAGSEELLVNNLTDQMFEDFDNDPHSEDHPEWERLSSQRQTI